MTVLFSIKDSDETGMQHWVHVFPTCLEDTFELYRHIRVLSKRTRPLYSGESAYTSLHECYVHLDA